MSRKKHEEMHDQSEDGSCIPGMQIGPLHDPCERLEITMVSEKIGENVPEKMHEVGACNISEFVTAPKAAKLIGCAPSTITRHCKAGKYQGAKKAQVDGVEAWQIPIASLPEHAQSMLREEVKAAKREKVASLNLPVPLSQELKFSPAEYSIIWEAYERSGKTHKRRAEAAQKALLTFQRLVDEGFGVGEAEKEVASQHGVSKPTLWRYRQTTKGHPQMHWLPLLSPRYKGGRPPAEFTDAAYDFILGRALNSSETPLAVVFDEARRQASVNGWVIPSDDAIRYRLEKEPAWLNTIGRKGPKALERSYPAIKRDYTSLKLHEVWESDGRKSDVFCIWPDGTIARPFIIVWREVRSRLVLGVKGFINPHAAGVLAAWGQALERAGTAPDYAKIDNGREYAAKSVTGGQGNRYRFKVVPGEQPGIMTMVGTKAEWSPPERGQDKPIESFWRFVADRCDKAPEFEGAYCGKDVVSKPENFLRENAIPIADFGAKLASVLEYFNTQHRHSGSGMGGKTPLEVYTELAAQTVRTPVAPAHIRLCKMGSAATKPAKVDASYTLTIPGYGVCRYWSKTIAELPAEVLSRKHFVYYDLENPRAPVSIYDGEAWLADAPQIDELPFLNAGDGAAEHVKKKNAYMKPKVQAVKQIKAKAEQTAQRLIGVTELRGLPPSIGSVTISNQKKLPTTGTTVASLSDEDAKELAELKRIQDEKKRRLNPHLYEHIGT
jgi:putative transposase